jgi:hypothetical protein
MKSPVVMAPWCCRLRSAGFTVRASDIVDRGCPDSFLRDFLADERISYRGTRIGCFTNPPFNRDEEFVMQACERYDYVAMVLRLRFLAAKHLVDDAGAATRSGEPLWQQTRIPFARVILPKSRWPMMHRDGFAGEKTDSSPTDCAIFVWEAGHRGPAVIVREPDERYQPNLLTGDAA